MNLQLITDSSGLFSLTVKTDINHPKALKISKNLLQTKGTIIIPGEIFAEVINILGKKIGKKVAIKTGRMFISSDIFTIIDTTNKIRLLAFKLFQNQPSSVSFTDCLVMAFADEYKTKDIFGFDEAFKKNGYKRVGIDK